MQMGIFYFLKPHSIMILLMVITGPNWPGIISSRYCRNMGMQITHWDMMRMNYQSRKQDRFIPMRSFQIKQLISANRLSPPLISPIIRKKEDPVSYTHLTLPTSDLV